jgi:ABC-type branched-subunit amino acid transport system substrate-binding protein
VWPCRLQMVIALAVGGLIAPAPADDDLAPQEQFGKKLYREGVAADGTSVKATLGQGSLTFPASRVPCASCHGSDGLGRPDAGVIPSNITWSNLTKSYGLRHANGRSHPPYTVETLVKAVTSGLDPAGNALEAAMPRYGLSDKSALDLIAYLKRLGTDSEHGVREKEIVVALVIPSDGPLAGIGNVVRGVLVAYFDRVNRDGGVYNRHVVFKTAALDPSGSAVGALRRLMSETGVFAVVAPVVPGEETALAEVAESSALPVVAPLAPYRRRAVERGSFTFHLTANLDDQASALVKYALTNLTEAGSKIAILSSDDGASLNIGDAVRQQGGNAAWASALKLRLTGETAITDTASELRRAGVSIIFYDGGPVRLVALAEEAARSAWRPAILTTGLAVTTASFARLGNVGARVFVAYPVLGSDQSPEVLKQLQLLQAAYDIPAQHLPMQVAALVSARILMEGLQRAGRDLTRSKFVAALGALQNFETGLVPPISFGPNQRTGVRGAHVVMLGVDPGKVTRSWISLD